MASEATKLDILGNMHIYSKVMEVKENHMPISHSPCRRRYIGPLPSCYIYNCLQRADGRYVLAGVVSWGIGCEGDGFYAKVSELVDWITYEISA